MPVFRRRTGSHPRLLPELDDTALGQVRRRVESCWDRGSLDTPVMALMADVLDDAGEDWDRKAHRLRVLAGSAGRALPGIWRERNPGNQSAVLLHAWSDLFQAGQEGSTIDLDATRESCRLAAELLPADPTPWTVYLATLRLERRPSTEPSAVWREIKARDPWNRDAHLQALGYLSPDECGSSGQVLDLLDSVRVMPPNAPAAGLELTALVRNHQRAMASGGVTALGAGEFWRRHDAVAMLDRAAHYWPSPGFLHHAEALADLNLLAYALIKASRPSDAATVLRATGGVATPWPWNAEDEPLAGFSRHYARARETV
ncbi:hypothetical protein FNJ62_05735 [Streptomyces benahoarensis]|uniref:DUF4034 domain-containing protein n=1 Tax=Streptomyces benahoarensis TaxID=2595054 RepID=A0A553YYW3_9ACTN|nr:hypothetical protein FNJ62_05735 [Streptomyces benahoarensis]TSB34382.1 hypothetical protein FNZ23_22340 [Streptomyces benahoarensis]